MDSLTQIVLGAAVGEVVLGKKVGNKAMLWGAIAGTIPDLDVYTSLFFDKLTANEMHRAFSHSILFSLIFAPILGWLIAKKEKLLFPILLALIMAYPAITIDNTIVRIVIAALYSMVVFLWVQFGPKTSGATVKNWSWLMFWGLFTHPLLDCHTTWGTQLLWPLPYKIAYNNIFVIDPLYTIPFLVCVAVAMFYKRTSIQRKRWNLAGILISTVYMLWSLGAKWHAHTVFTDNLVEQNIEYTRLTTVPTPLNTLLWVGTADTDTTYHVALYSLLDSDREVEFYQVSNRHELLGDYANDEVVNRLKFLAKDWYAMRQYGDSLVFNDARFGAFFTDLDNPEYVFGYHLKEGEEGLEAIQGDPPTGEMEEVLKNLITRMLGE